MYGPLLRFDPHALPTGDDPDHGVWYGASTPDAALGEAFQVDRTIDRALDSPYLTGLSFTRPLTLLSAVVVLLIRAFGLVVCGLFANGWGVKGAASALLVAPTYDVVLVLLALRTAIDSAAAPRRTPQNENDL
jgi:hypothetical protein